MQVCTVSLSWELQDSQSVTSCALLFASALATLGVVTTRRKLKKTVQKKKRRLLSPTAARGSVPSRPTIATPAHQVGVSVTCLMDCTQTSKALQRGMVSRQAAQVGKRSRDCTPVSTSIITGSRRIASRAGNSTAMISRSYCVVNSCCSRVWVTACCRAIQAVSSFSLQEAVSVWSSEFTATVGNLPWFFHFLMTLSLLAGR